MKRFLQCCSFALAVMLSVGCAEKEALDNKLPAPGSLKVSADNVLTWSIVKGAVGYLPNINGEDCAQVSSNQMDLTEMYTGGHLSIKVKAVADGVTKQDSDWSQVLEYDMAVALATPQPVVTGKTVSWEAVEGASGYEYEINGSIVITESTTVDLSEYLAEIYTIKVRAIPADNKLYSPSSWSSEVTVAIFDRLATPQLTVNGSSLKNPDSASVSWLPVTGASGYEVLVDGVKREVDGTVVDFTGQIGTFNVKVTAVNPGLYDASETAEAEITVRNYGNGTAENPFMIYTAQDWHDFSENVSTNEGVSGYFNKYLELASDIDFENTYVKPAGVSTLLSFKGTLDGKNHTLKNAKIGDGTASHQAFFYLLNGTVKNLNFEKITVTGGNATGAASSAAVISAGNSSLDFTIDNCHVSNSTITSGPHDGDKGGSYAAGLVGRCNNANATIRNCSVTNTTISCLVENTGGVIGLLAAGVIENVKSSGNTITGGNRYVGGIAGNITTGTLTNIESTDNTITAKLNAGGVTGGMSDATLINAVSKNNTCTVASVSCGGVVGLCEGTQALIINVLSDGNAVKSTSHQNVYYLGGLIGGSGKNNTVATIANCIILGGTADYEYDSTKDTSKPYAGCVGIALGYNWNKDGVYEYIVSNSIIHQAYRTRFDLVWLANDATKEYCRDAIGIKKSVYAKESDGGVLGNFTRYLDQSLTDGTALTMLNNWVETNKSTYPSLKTWTADQNGYPKL